MLPLQQALQVCFASLPGCAFMRMGFGWRSLRPFQGALDFWAKSTTTASKAPFDVDADDESPQQDLLKQQPLCGSSVPEVFMTWALGAWRK